MSKVVKSKSSPKSFSIKSILDLDDVESSPKSLDCPPVKQDECSRHKQDSAKDRVMEEEGNKEDQPPSAKRMCSGQRAVTDQENIKPIIAATHSTQARPSKRKQRSKFTDEQLELLEREFEESTHLTRDQLNALSTEVGLAPNQVQIWFQNRRAKTRKRLAAQQRLAAMKMSSYPFPYTLPQSSHPRQDIKPCLLNREVEPHMITPLPLIAGWPLAFQLNFGVQLQPSNEQHGNNRGEQPAQKEYSFVQTKKTQTKTKVEPFQENTNI